MPSNVPDLSPSSVDAADQALMQRAVPTALPAWINRCVSEQQMLRARPTFMVAVMLVAFGLAVVGFFGAAGLKAPKTSSLDHISPTPAAHNAATHGRAEFVSPFPSESLGLLSPELFLSQITIREFDKRRHANASANFEICDLRDVFVGAATTFLIAASDELVPEAQGALFRCCWLPDLTRRAAPDELGACDRISVKVCLCARYHDKMVFSRDAGATPERALGRGLVPWGESMLSVVGPSTMKASRASTAAPGCPSACPSRFTLSISSGASSRCSASLTSLTLLGWTLLPESYRKISSSQKNLTLGMASKSFTGGCCASYSRPEGCHTTSRFSHSCPLARTSRTTRYR